MNRRGSVVFGSRALSGPRDQCGGAAPYFCLCIPRMDQARKRNSIEGRRRHAWPTAVRAVILFAPSDDRPAEAVVQFLDYSIFTVLQVTSIAQTPFTVSDLIVNGEFRPTLVVGSLSERFSPLRLPVQMNSGSSFGAVLQAPVSTAVLPFCYPKVPAFLLISTEHGDFVFDAGEIIRPDGSSPVTMDKFCADL